MDVYPHWETQSEQMGSKDKFWFRDPDDPQECDWLFKFPTENTGQHWAEKISGEIARTMRILAPKVELAQLQEPSGDLKFLDDRVGERIRRPPCQLQYRRITIIGMNDQKTLFLGWRDPQEHRWYPVGRLDVNDSPRVYTFGYTQGAMEAEKQSGFGPLYDFPSFQRRYTSPGLFPLFKNRVMNDQRKSFEDYLSFRDIDGASPDPLEILAVDGGYRATDNFQVFPKIRKQSDGSFYCRFFLHGWRHTNSDAQEQIERLRSGESLYVTIELTNPQTRLAVQIQTTKYHMIGWAPRYLVHDLVTAMAHAPGDYSAQVVKLNPVPAPSQQRVLIELSGHWPTGYEPMDADEFKLLSGEDATTVSLGG